MWKMSPKPHAHRKQGPFLCAGLEGVPSRHLCATTVGFTLFVEPNTNSQQLNYILCTIRRIRRAPCGSPTDTLGAQSEVGRIAFGRQQQRQQANLFTARLQTPKHSRAGRSAVSLVGSPLLLPGESWSTRDLGGRDLLVECCTA